MNPANYTPINLSSFTKEAEPSRGREVIIKEVVETEDVINKELAPFIQKNAETIPLPPDLKKVGVKASTTNQSLNYQEVVLPISDDRVVTGLKSPLTSSLRWLATLALYILRQAHLGLRVVHGKAIRVLRG